MPTRHAQGIFAMLMMAATFACAGCGGGSPFKPLDLTPPTEAAPPAAGTPQGVVERLSWAFAHRDMAVYEELFTEDFVEAGDPPILGELLDAPSTEITFMTAPIVPIPDTRPGRSGPAHKLIQTRVTIRIERPDSPQVEDVDFNFFVVRGDSALVPEDTIERYGEWEAHSTHRWYIERVEDSARSVPVAAASVYTAPRRSHPSSLEPSARRPGRER